MKPFKLGLKKFAEVPDSKPVLVVWDDAWSLQQAGGTKEVLTEVCARPQLRYSVGWMVLRDANHIVLCGTCDPPGGVFGEDESHFEDVTRIPRKMVLKVIDLCSPTPKSRSRSTLPSSSLPKSRLLPSLQPPASPSPPSSVESAESKPDGADRVEKFLQRPAGQPLNDHFDY